MQSGDTFNHFQTNDPVPHYQVLTFLRKPGYLKIFKNKICVVIAITFTD